MANRTFKVYGQAYAASDDVNVTMTVNGTQVFSGAVNDSSTVRSGPPNIQNHLWTYELDENTTGNLTVSVAVTGGELCLGPTTNNHARKEIVPQSWMDAHQAEGLTAANQTHLATEIGQTLLDAEQAGLYDKLVAGTATEADATDITNANAKGDGGTDYYQPINDVRNTLAINGDPSAAPIASAVQDNEQSGWWPILQDGDTLTYTWAFDPYTDAYVVTE